MERWRNKVAVVTGAGGGIGSAICKYLVAKDMVVVGLDIRSDWVENKLKTSLPDNQETRFHALKCDVSKDEDVLDAFRWVEQNLGGVDVLVNNAGIHRETQIVAANNTADLKAVVDVNIIGVALCTREAFQSMKKRGVDGHVVIINSIAGHIVPNIPGYDFNIYPPTKHALTAMTEVLRHEFLANGTKIKITSISPGATDTGIINRETFPASRPFLRPEDIADAVVYTIQTPPHVQIHEIMIKPVGEIE